MKEYQLQNVTIDDQSFFSAYVLVGEDWNGFALPYFTLEVGKRLCDYLNADKNDEWEVVNITDEVIATPIISKSEAFNFVRDFPNNFKEQGYYLTANGKKIQPTEVKLEIQPAESEGYEEKSHYHEGADSFIIYELSDSDEYEPIEYSGVNILVNGETIHVYPIGAYNWIWSVGTQLN